MVSLRICHVLFFLSVFIFISEADSFEISDAKLAVRDSIWYANNPGQLPQWETLEERKLRKFSANNILKKDMQSILSAAPSGKIRNIAEFEPMEGVLIAYTDKFGISTNLIKEMAKNTKVFCKVSKADTNEVRKQLQDGGVLMSNVIFIVGDVDSYWTRDYGPWWIMNETSSAISVIKFTYNRDRPNDQKTPGTVASFLNVAINSMPIIHCGGNYMCDGGVAAVSTELVCEENKSLSSAKIDEIFKQYLGIEKYHITIDPLGDYIKHVDCWGKFLGPDKILIGQVTGANSSKYDSVAAYFSRQKSAWGTPYKVYRIKSDGEPYTNSLILNNNVFVPVNGTKNDSAAIAVYKTAMPGYKVSGFTGSWMSTDALHCRTIGIPDRGMLYVNHTPLHDTIGNCDNGIKIETAIVPYSKKRIIADSTLVYYRFNEKDDYIPVKLKYVQGNIYSCLIPLANKSSQVFYYIHTADSSGRSENHPYTGGADPHSFYCRFTSTIKSVNLQNNLALMDVNVSNTGSGIVISYWFSLPSLKANLSLYDISGKELVYRKLNSAKGKISLDAKSGIYIVNVNVRNGAESFTRTIKVVR